MELTREQLETCLDPSVPSWSVYKIMRNSVLAHDAALRARLAACEVQLAEEQKITRSTATVPVETLDTIEHQLAQAEARVQALEQEQARLRATLVKIAKPALGGKQQQQWAREALKGG